MEKADDVSTLFVIPGIPDKKRVARAIENINGTAMCGACKKYFISDPSSKVVAPYLIASVRLVGCPHCYTPNHMRS